MILKYKTTHNPVPGINKSVREIGLVSFDHHLDKNFDIRDLNFSIHRF